MVPCSYRCMERKPYFKCVPSAWFEERYGIPFAGNSDVRVCGYYFRCPCGRRHLKPTCDGQPFCPGCGRVLRYLGG
eukprot:3104273-Lingulodinium_polyedra.AAC.1